MHSTNLFTINAITLVLISSLFCAQVLCASVASFSLANSGIGSYDSIHGGFNLNNDSYSDVVVGAPTLKQAFVFFGSNTPSLTNSANFSANTNSYGWSFGSGDLNGDSIDDLVVGAQDTVYVYYGSNTLVDNSPDFQFTASGASAVGTGFGYQVAVGDFNGDGRKDVAISAPNYTNTETNEGAVFFYQNSVSGFTDSFSFVKESNWANAQLGFSISFGNLNGDSFDDLVVGAPFYNNGVQSEIGAVMIYFGSATGPQSSLQINSIFSIPGAHFGWAVCSGNWDGDSYGDFCTGAPGIAPRGNITCYKGSPSGPAYLNQSPQMGAAPSVSQLGSSLSSVGLINGDNREELFVGSISEGHGYEGTSTGPKAAPTPFFVAAATGVPFIVSAAGDFDDDKSDDILVANPDMAILYYKVLPSPSPSKSASPTRSPSVTPSISVSPSVTPSVSVSSSVTPSTGSSPSVTPSESISPSVSPSPTISPSNSPSSSISPSPSVSPPTSSSPSNQPSTSPSSSISVSPSISRSSDPSPSSSTSSSPSISSAPSMSSTPSISTSPSSTPSSSPETASSKKKSNNSSVIGIAVGVGGGGLLCAGAVGFFLLKRKQKKEEPPYELERVTSEPSTPAISPNYVTMHRVDSDPTASSFNKNASVNSLNNSDFDKRWEIPYSEIVIGKQIGSGAFGTVYKAEWRNCDCVVKQLSVERTDKKAIADFLKEAKTVRNVRNHKNVCTIFGVCLDPQFPICIVMEYVSGGSLYNLVIRDDVPFEPLTVVRFGKDITGGMSHIHKENILHCDLAARNLLVEKSNNRYVVKVTDFGLSRVTESGTYNASTAAVFPVRWSAPEVIEKLQVSRASDVWSFGVVMWEILEGKQPYYGMTNPEVVEHVCQKKLLLAKPSRFDYPNEIWQIMLACWRWKPEERPTFEELYKQFSELERTLKQGASEENENASSGASKSTSSDAVYGNNPSVSISS